MSDHKFILLNSPESDQLGTFSHEFPAGDHRQLSVHCGKLNGGVSENVSLITIDNGLLQVDVLPERGMGLWRMRLGEMTIGWNSPVSQPVHPSFVNLSGRGGLGWLDGFNELLCRCGLAHNGPPGIDEQARSPIESEVTLHGRIANTPAHCVSVEFHSDPEPTLLLNGDVRETTLFGPNLLLSTQLEMTSQSPTLRITDRVTNDAAHPCEAQLLYHINIGAPILEAGARLVAAAKTVTPRDSTAALGIDTYADCKGPTDGYSEEVYFFDLLSDEAGISKVMLVNQTATLGLALEFDTHELPCFAFWKNTQSLRDGYCIGLEPGINFPNFKSFERQQGRVKLLEPGESFRTSIKMQILTESQEIQSVIEETTKLQATHVVKIHPRPTQPNAVPD